MPKLLAANKLLQLSHMEILSEGARPEPRLRRLLGHINTYDSVTRWRIENEKQIHAAEIVKRDEARPQQASTPALHASSIPSSSTLRLCTLAEFQAFVQAHSNAPKVTTVTMDEVFPDSDSDNEDDEDESLSDESDNESTWSEDEDPIMELIKEGTRCLLRQDAGDDVMLKLSTSREMVLQQPEER